MAGWFGNFFLGFLNGSLRSYLSFGLGRSFRLNLLVCPFSALTRYTFSRFVPYWFMLIKADVRGTYVMGFAHCKLWRKEVHVPYINV